MSSYEPAVTTLPRGPQVRSSGGIRSRTYCDRCHRTTCFQDTGNPLAELDDAEIDPGELQSFMYGPSTANAVPAYKQTRNIVNRSYQAQADNIVGKMTIAALDQEMFEKEAEGPGPNTCQLLLACPCDSPNIPVLRLGFAITAPTTGAALTDAQVMAQAFQDSRKTLRLAVAALNALQIGLVARAVGSGDLNPENERVFTAVKRWLNLRTATDQDEALGHIRTASSLMIRNLGVKTGAGADPLLRRVSASFFTQRLTEIHRKTAFAAGLPSSLSMVQTAQEMSSRRVLPFY